MDNLTHGLFGVAMARAGLAKNRPWAVPLLAIAGNAPDFESLIPAGSTANYLLYHRGISHSVVGLFIEAFVLTLATLGILKFWRSRKNDPTPLPNPLVIYGIAWLGAASHILLDWFNSYGVWPWRPFSDAVYYGDFAFIIDPWFWLLLWSGCFLAAPATRSTRIVYGGIGSLMAAVLFWATTRGMLPTAVVGLWLGLAFVVLTLRIQIDTGKFAGGSPYRFAQIGLVVLAGYLVSLYASSYRARSLVEQQFTTAKPAYVSTQPTPGRPWRYIVLADFGDRVERYDVNAWSSSFEKGPDFETRRNDPALDSIRGTIEYKAWTYFARHRVLLRDGNTLVLGDARYRIWDGRADWTEMRVPLPPASAAPAQ
jgi:inner membrane protein